MYAEVGTATKYTWISPKDVAKYGLTQDQFETLYEEQDYCCGNCQKRETQLQRRLGIDHNHKTGKVRGLLCNGCNLALGRAEKSGKYTQSQLDYLADAEDRAEWLYPATD